MGCRCKDIRKCLKDISTIGEIEGLVNNLEGTNVSVSMELQSLAINCMSTFYCANMGELRHMKINNKSKVAMDIFHKARR
jgi:hypothetical protein